MSLAWKFRESMRYWGLLSERFCHFCLLAPKSSFRCLRVSPRRSSLRLVNDSFFELSQVILNKLWVLRFFSCVLIEQLRLISWLFPLLLCCRVLTYRLLTSFFLNLLILSCILSVFTRRQSSFRLFLKLFSIIPLADSWNYRFLS